MVQIKVPTFWSSTPTRMKKLRTTAGLAFALILEPPQGKLLCLGSCASLCRGWVKEIQTWTLPTLLGVYGHQFSPKQLRYACESMPIVVPRHQRGARGGGAAAAKERMVERKKQKETEVFLTALQLPRPSTPEEWRFVWREMGPLLAAKHFSSPIVRSKKWTCPWQTSLTLKNIFGSEPCVMKESPSSLRSFVN